MRASALLFALSIPLFLSKASQACSVCGCDPSGGTLGLDRPTMRDVRLALENRYLWKESGSVDEGTREGERENRLGLRAQYSPPVPRLSMQFDVPYTWKVHYGVSGEQDDTNQGLGDVSLTGRWEALWFGGVVPRHVVALLGTLKAPTGSNAHLAPIDGDVVDEHKQIGTGTWDELVGISYVYGDFPTVVYANVSARFNGTNSRGNHYGNAIFGTVGVRRSFLETKRLYLSLDAQVRNAGKDTVPGNTYDENSGGFLAYATVSAGYAITDNLLIRGTVQVPVVTALNGVQSEHPVAYLALAYDFGL
jgi:putative salt-induced outer membrane protein YdiY